jgi:hypothetical protein
MWATQVVADGITLRLAHPLGAERWFDSEAADTQTEVMAVTWRREVGHVGKRAITSKQLAISIVRALMRTPNSTPRLRC